MESKTWNQPFQHIWLKCDKDQERVCYSERLLWKSQFCQQGKEKVACTDKLFCPTTHDVKELKRLKIAILYAAADGFISSVMVF